MSGVDQPVASRWHLERSRRASRDRGVPDTPEAREHAEHAEQIREWLADIGVFPEVVAPTRDGRGHVRLNFDQVETMLFEDEED